MHAIIPQKLWIGNTRDGRDARTLFDNQIRAVIDLAAEESPAQLPRELTYFRIPLLDGCGNDPASLKIAVTIVATHLDEGVSLLVCCGAGLSRSPSVTAFALAQSEGMSPHECLNRIRECQPVDVSPGLWNDLEQFSARS